MHEATSLHTRLGSALALMFVMFFTGCTSGPNWAELEIECPLGRARFRWEAGDARTEPPTGWIIEDVCAFDQFAVTIYAPGYGQTGPRYARIDDHPTVTTLIETTTADPRADDTAPTRPARPVFDDEPCMLLTTSGSIAFDLGADSASLALVTAAPLPLTAPAAYDVSATAGGVRVETGVLAPGAELVVDGAPLAVAAYARSLGARTLAFVDAEGAWRIETPGDLPIVAVYRDDVLEGVDFLH